MIHHNVKIILMSIKVGENNDDETEKTMTLDKLRKKSDK